MGTMFRAAVMNDMIQKHPMDGVRFTKPVRAVDDIKCLTTDEQQSYRTIPLTSHAYDILKQLYSQVSERKESELLNSTLEYMDRRTGETASLCMRDLVFINWRTGEPAKTVPMIPTYISSATKRGSSTFVCTPCDIPMLQEQSKAVCSRRCCKNCWVMPASKQQWIGMFM